MPATTQKIIRKPANPIDRTIIKDLPPKACVQRRSDGMISAYFAYNYRIDGVNKQERDYLGIVVDNQFIPNDYYKYAKPTKENRPIERWSNPIKRKIEEEKLLAKARSKDKPVQTPADDTSKASKLAESLDTPPTDHKTISVGATYILMLCLNADDMIKDIARALKYDVKSTIDSINLGLQAAITNDPTYMAEYDAGLQKYIGWQGCLSSQRASELHQKLGAMSDLSIALGKQRAKRTKKGDLIALDSTRIACQSDNIVKAQKGKSKKGTFEKQVSISLLFNAATGSTISYRTYAGNTNDCKTLEDVRALWKEFGHIEKAPVMIADRGYSSIDQMVQMDKDGIRFLFAVKTNWSAVQFMINDGQDRFFQAQYKIPYGDCYGVKERVKFRSQNGERPLNVFVYRSPETEMKETDKFLKSLTQFEKAWEKDNTLQPTDELAQFYKPIVPGERPQRDYENINYHCYGFGYFAYVSNHYTTPDQALEAYSYRNEVEICFKNQMKLLPTTRVHSDVALDGLMFTTFIGTSALSNLMFRMRRSDGSEDNVLRKKYSVAELLKKLRMTQLVHIPGQEPYLIDNGTEIKQIVAALGFEGALDHAEKVVEMLSATELERKFAQWKKEDSE